ncbi:hypothetical protein DIURU_001714 [Diutina rugosa]|uniref:C2H2-type domain-containing protein n=1 Tax=Diutina rugosa TaxID=5481 RepID=A0A642UTN5_DIURU|nr:uncharacterized protein DIURU_001714 [Diutina rugosa]KAA8905286.1 hypothetical protein DIURU_001714 [Diutina rugosa]
MSLPWLVFPWPKKSACSVTSDNDRRVYSTPPAAQRHFPIDPSTRVSDNEIDNDEKDDVEEEKDDAEEGNDDAEEGNDEGEEFEENKEGEEKENVDDGADIVDHGADNDKECNTNDSNDEDIEPDDSSQSQLITDVNQRADPDEDAVRHFSDHGSQSLNNASPHEESEESEESDDSDMEKECLEDSMKCSIVGVSHNCGLGGAETSSKSCNEKLSGINESLAADTTSSPTIAHEERESSGIAPVQMRGDEVSSTVNQPSIKACSNANMSQPRQQILTKHGHNVELGLKILSPSYDGNPNSEESPSSQEQISSFTTEEVQQTKPSSVFKPSLKALKSIGSTPSHNSQSLKIGKSNEVPAVSYTNYDYLERKWSSNGGRFYPWEHYELAKCMARQYNLRPISIDRFVEMATKDVKEFMYKMYKIAICNTGPPLKHSIYKDSPLVKSDRVLSGWKPPSVLMTPMVLPMYFSYVQMCENTKTDLLPFPGTIESREFMKEWTERKRCPFRCSNRRYYGVETHILGNHYKNGHCDGCDQRVESASDFLLHAETCPSILTGNSSQTGFNDESSDSEEVSIIAVANRSPLKIHKRRRVDTDSEDDKSESKHHSTFLGRLTKRHQSSSRSQRPIHRSHGKSKPSLSSSPQTVIGQSTLLEAGTQRSPPHHPSYDIRLHNSSPVADQNDYDVVSTQDAKVTRNVYPSQSLVHVPASPITADFSIGPPSSEIDICEGWRCPYPHCSAVFNENYMLMMHLDLHAERRMAKYSCPYVKSDLCKEEIVVNKAQFEEHMEAAHYDSFAEGYSAGKCKHCSKTFASVDMFLSHTGDCVSTYKSSQLDMNKGQGST